MRELPILFSTDMVKAILEGRKSQTRRVVKGTPLQWLEEFTPSFVADPENNLCPYGKVGDVLWVRERWMKLIHRDRESEYGYPTEVHSPEKLKWKPSIHMPKDIARIWLEVTDVRVERLQDINEEDAIEEGVEQNRDGSWHDYLEPTRLWQDCAKASFQSLWMKLNGLESWNSNPFVWVISFKVLTTTGKPVQLTENNIQP